MVMITMARHRVMDQLFETLIEFFIAKLVAAHVPQVTGRVRNNPAGKRR